jgi:hypothetical protein
MKVDPYTQLLQQVLIKYRYGRDHSVHREVAYLNEIEIGYYSLSISDQLLINKFENVRVRGVLAARKGDLDTAKQLFVSAGVLLESELLSGEGQLFYRSSMEQGEAFLDCRRGDFHSARNRIFNSLSIDQKLEDYYGHNHLILRRIQHVHNLARVEAYDHQMVLALRLILETLSYLDGKQDSIEVPGLWGYERIACQKASDVGTMFMQLSGEIALFMAGLNCEDAGKLFASASVELISLHKKQICHPHAYRWLLIKKAYSYGNLNVFLNDAANFIANRKIGMELLLHAVFVDLINICDKLDTPIARELKWEIKKDCMISPEKIHSRFLPFFQFKSISYAA